MNKCALILILSYFMPGCGITSSAPSNIPSEEAIMPIGRLCLVKMRMMLLCMQNHWVEKRNKVIKADKFSSEDLPL